VPSNHAFRGRVCVLSAGDAPGVVAKLLVQSPDKPVVTAPSGRRWRGAVPAVYTAGHVADDAWLIEASQMFAPLSAADEPLLVFGVTLTLDWDPGERDINRAQVLAGKLNGGRPEILVQAF
jgi:hypothetical protein